MRKSVKTIIAIIVVIGILVCVKSCVDRKEPDLTMAYIGNGFVNRTAFEENIGDLYHLCNDIESDGEIHIDIMEISFSDKLGSADKQNSNQKLANALGAGAARVYFIDEAYVISNAGKGVFEDISHLGDGFKSPDGEVVAISVEGNGKLEKLGIDTDNLYLAVRVVSEMDVVMDKSIEAKHASAMNIAEYILNN